MERAEEMRGTRWETPPESYSGQVIGGVGWWVGEREGNKSDTWSGVTVSWVVEQLRCSWLRWLSVGGLKSRNRITGVPFSGRELKRVSSCVQSVLEAAEWTWGSGSQTFRLRAHSYFIHDTPKLHSNFSLSAAYIYAIFN